MSNEEAKRKVKEILKEIQAEEKQKQTSPVQTSKKLAGKQELLRYLRESSTSVKEDEVIPRYKYSYADRESKDFPIQINAELLEKARVEATQRKMSLASYIRESLIYRLYKTAPEKELEIDQLLEDCTNPENKTLIVGGKEGFLNQIAEKGLTGEVWSPSQIDKVALRLRLSPRSTEDQCLGAMKLDKIQTQYFKTQVEYLRNTQPEQEAWFVPFGICDNCRRPLTKDQINNLSNCPYCNGTKGTPFVYDEKSPAQPKPYAMCKECHRALLKEAKTWKECKYCGTHEQEIVLNYEGIQRQTPSSTLTLDKEETKKILELAEGKHDETEES